jgi:vanillate O-demethylase ferredoxin subunit
MAHDLHRGGTSFALHYCAHSRATAPFLAELEAGPLGRAMELYLGAGPDPRRFDAARVLAEEPDAHVYVCGPSRLQDGVVAAAEALGWAPERIHLERFTADVDRKGDPFTVVAARSGITVQIPPERSIAQMLTEQGIEVPISCEQGVCGTCVTRVLEGVVDHRDLFLSDAEKAGNARITVCCSRAKAGETLVLDI